MAYGALAPHPLPTPTTLCTFFQVLLWEHADYEAWRAASGSTVNLLCWTGDNSGSFYIRWVAYWCDGFGSNNRGSGWLDTGGSGREYEWQCVYMCVCGRER